MTTPSVLFVCVRDGGTSQMAAGLMWHAARDAVAVHSAGPQPGNTINALSAQTLAEVGADMSMCSGGSDFSSLRSLRALNAARVPTS